MLSIALISFFLLHLMTVTTTLTPQYNAKDSFLLNCGAPSVAIDESDGRRWDTDTHYPNILPSNFSSISTTPTASEQDPSVNRVPYTNARIFRVQFTYTFRVSPGHKFIRLYFYPSSYLGIRRAESFFSVTANNLTLFSNFNAFLTVAASTNSSKAIRKEFVISVNGAQTLKITFSPSPNCYAFVNGIEILSMPTDLYIHGDVTLVGYNNPYSIDNSTALETLYRLNVGGKSVAGTEDTGMYRVWDSDEEFVVGDGFQTPHLDVNINYTSETPAFTAPNIVYTTARTTAYKQRLDWIFPLESGFHHLFRFHFCEIQLEVRSENHRIFDIYIGDQIAERAADVFTWSDGWRVPVYRDYVVYLRDEHPYVLPSQQNVTLELRPNRDTNSKAAILNGLEIFKLSDSNSYLSDPYPELLFEGPIESPPNNKKKRISWHIIVAIIAGVTRAIAVFSILGFLILRRRNGGKDSGTSVPKSSSLPSDKFFTLFPSI